MVYTYTTNYPSLFQFFKFKLIELQKGKKKLWENTRRLIMGYTVYIYNSSSDQTFEKAWRNVKPELIKKQGLTF